MNSAIKYEHVVFCKLTPLQTSIYENFITSKAMKKLLNEESGQQPLQSITLLKKLCNHPSLCVTDPTGGGSGGSRMKKVSRDVLQSSVDLNLFPEDYDFSGIEIEFSGKLLLLEKMMTKVFLFYLI
jgi:DNA repair and recombination RAD54-like protein